MSKLSKKTLAAFAIASLVLAPAAHAEETKSGGLTGFFRKLFNYPGKAVQSTADTTGHALSNTGEKVFSDTGEKLSQGNAEGLVQPIVGAVETTATAGAEAARMPVTAAEEASKAVDHPAGAEHPKADHPQQ